MTRKLRSEAWFGGTDKDAFIHRSWMLTLISLWAAVVQPFSAKAIDCT